MPDHLSPHMLTALRDIASKRRGTIARTERALRSRGLIQSSDEWPFVEATPAGRDALGLPAAITTVCGVCRDWPIIGTPDAPGRMECRCRQAA